jgi:hypothetical protein
MNPSFNHGYLIDTNDSHTTLIIPLCFQFGGEPREKNELSEQPEPAKKEGKHKNSVSWLLVSTQHPQLFLREKDTQ